MPRAGPSSPQAKPLTNAETGTVPFAGIVSTKMGLSPLPGFEKAVHPAADHPSPTWPDVATTLIPEKVVVRRPSRARRIIGTQGLVAILVCMSQVAVQEAPAWGLSMVVHMVTLVTMAIVVVPSTIPHNRNTSSLHHPNSSRSKWSRISPTGSRRRWTIDSRDGDTGDRFERRPGGGGF